MEKKPSRREAFYFYNSLIGLVKSLENKYIVIDLRNESSVTGKAVNVDGFMNVDLEDAAFYDARGNETLFDSFFIRTRNIRYVHVPDDVNMFETIKNFGAKEIPQGKKKPTFKLKRAEKQQQATLQELALKESQQ